MEKLSFGQKPKVLVVGAGPIGSASGRGFVPFRNHIGRLGRRGQAPTLARRPSACRCRYGEIIHS